MNARIIWAASAAVVGFSALAIWGTKRAERHRTEALAAAHSFLADRADRSAFGERDRAPLLGAPAGSEHAQHHYQLACTAAAGHDQGIEWLIENVGLEQERSAAVEQWQDVGRALSAAAVAPRVVVSNEFEATLDRQAMGRVGQFARVAMHEASARGDHAGFVDRCAEALTIPLDLWMTRSEPGEGIATDALLRTLALLDGPRLEALPPEQLRRLDALLARADARVPQASDLVLWQLAAIADTIEDDHGWVVLGNTAQRATVDDLLPAMGRMMDACAQMENATNWRELEPVVADYRLVPLPFGSYLDLLPPTKALYAAHAALRMRRVAVAALLGDELPTLADPLGDRPIGALTEAGAVRVTATDQDGGELQLVVARR